MRICPNCGRVISFNSYFGAYICDRCKWEDATIERRRRCGITCYRVASSEGRIVVGKVAAQSIITSGKCKGRKIVLNRKMG